MKRLKLFKLCLLLVFCAGAMYGVLSCAHKNDDKNPTAPVVSADGEKIAGVGAVAIPTPKPDATPKPNATATPKPSSGGTVLLNDPLTNGTSIATQIGGGEFTPEGYHLTSHFGYIIYDTNITGNFRVEFDAKGFDPNESYHDPDDQSTILFMQDAPLGTDWTQWRIIPNCLFQLIKLTWYPGAGDSAGAMKVKGACGGGGGYELWSHRPGSGEGGQWLATEFWWDPDKTYHWKVIVKNGHVDVYRDDVYLFYGDGFYPGDPMRFFFGGTGTWVGQVSPDNVTYSNIKVYKEN